MASTLRIALGQLNLLVGDIAGNADQVIAAAIRARDELAADAIVFPELTLTGYPPEDLLLRPGLYDRVLFQLERVAQQVAGITLIVGYPRRTLAGTFNAAAVISDGQLVAHYHKQQLPNYSVFDEKRYFSHGSEACVVTIAGVPVGITLCEDIWHPGPMSQAVAAGARLVVNLNASPYHLSKGGEREAVVAERVAESRVPVVYVNLVGGQDELVFDGESFVMDGDGQVVLRSPAFAASLDLATFDLEAGVVLPRLGEVAPLLGDEESVYRALVSGIRDYVEKNGFRGVVIGLSGGIDSALTLALAVDALGAGRVEAVMMPSCYTAAMSIEDARQQAETQGVGFRRLPIEPGVAAINATLAESFSGYASDVTEENIQARIRGVLLMAISNKFGWMVLSTGNKSEMAVGYATLYGDMVGGFCALKDVPKSLVFRLARYRNGVSPVIPQRVIDRPPSAELAPDQKDSDSLPDYPTLDRILELYVEQDYCRDEIVAAGFDLETVTRVIRLVDRNEYKRRQAPPGVRITRRAFGRDRRYPLTSGYGRQ